MSNVASTITMPATPATDAGSIRLAAIDVGSNSLHMVVAQADADGGITTLWRIKEPIGLGRLSFPSKRLSKVAIDLAIHSLARFQQAARQRQCEHIICIATSAVREATNGGDLIERAKAELKLHIRVISAREEARLIYLAVRHALPLKKEPALLIDIGGGSVEFTVGDELKAHLLESRKLGAARMTAKFVRSDPLSLDDRRALRRHYDAELDPLFTQIDKLEPSRVIGTSGTLENLAAMCAAAGGTPGEIAREPFEAVLKQLAKSDSKARVGIPGLDDGRRDQILAGALLVEAILDRSSARRIEICPAALREGVLLDYLARHVPDLQIRREVPDARRRSVLDLARRCNWHRVHSEHVTRLALELFDALRAVHGLGAAERELFDYAFLLHDIGWLIGREDHHKHAAYLIRHGHLKGFTPREVDIIACIARYHRGPLPKKRHRTYALLGLHDRRIVHIGAGLLRIADGLDRSHAQVVTGLSLRVMEDGITCKVFARADPELELWGAKRKRDLFEQSLRRRIRFRAD